MLLKTTPEVETWNACVMIKMVGKCMYGKTIMLGCFSCIRSKADLKQEYKAKVAKVYFCIPKAPMGVLKRWVGMLNWGVGPRSILMIGFVRSLWNVLFMSVHHNSFRISDFCNFWDNLLLWMHLNFFIMVGFLRKLRFSVFSIGLFIQWWVLYSVL